MLDRDAAIEIVRNYAQEIESHGVHLRNVILYGSFAKGMQHEWSALYFKQGDPFINEIIKTGIKIR